jgi:hypothetical protein
MVSKAQVTKIALFLPAVTDLASVVQGLLLKFNRLLDSPQNTVSQSQTAELDTLHPAVFDPPSNA